MNIDPWIETFTRNKSNNNIFYHMLCINDAVSRFLRTYEKIKLSGLIDEIDKIYLNCVGKQKYKYFAKINSLYKVHAMIGTHSKDESETINYLRDYCIKNKDGNSLYIHSKGVTRPRNIRDHYWKDCMEYFLIEKFKDCLNILSEYDNCGVFFRTKQVTKNRIDSWYAGNFWWATNTYISSLNICTRNNRWDAEARFLYPHKSRYKEWYRPEKPFRFIDVKRECYTNDLPLI